MLRRQTSSSLVLVELQKSNDELRSKLSESLIQESSLESSSGLLSKLCEKETEELRLTVGRLERLLALEREERQSNEEKAIELLSDVKRQWMEREEARIGIMRSEVEAAQNNAHESARRNAKILQELERSTSELENALDIKNKLKDKCQELKAKLENLKTAYKDRLAETGRIHEAAARLEARSELHEEQALKAAAQLANREKAHREELEELRRQRHGQETRISELKQEVTRLEDQVEDARARLNQEAGKAHGALADLKEAQLHASETEEQSREAREKTEALGRKMKDLEARLEEQRRTYEVELEAMEENRRFEEERERKEHIKLKEEVRRLQEERRDASFLTEESEKRATGLEKEMKRMEALNNELRDKKEDLERRVNRIREESKVCLLEKETALEKIQGELQSMEEAKASFEKQSKAHTAEMMANKETHKEMKLKIKTLEKDLARQREELETRDSSGVHEDANAADKLALEAEKERLESLEAILTSQREEYEAKKRELNEEDARCKKESVRLHVLVSELRFKDTYLSSLGHDLQKERESLSKEEDRLQRLQRDLQVSKEKEEAQREEREKEHDLRLKKTQVELSETHSREVLELNSRIEALSQEREDLSKKLRDRKEALKSENEAEKVKKEMNLMKVDLRIANKQVTEHKETISYLRQSYRDERDSARKLQEELLDVKAREESLASEVESLKRSLCSAQEDKEAMSKLKDELASKSSELKSLGFKLSNAEFESERCGSRLEKAEKEVIKYRESQTQLNIYKAACLELENQAKEFDTVIEKLEEKNEKLSGELSQSKASSQESEAKGTALKIEINDLKSKLIFAQSQLKESQSKVGEMEGIYKAEEGKLRERLEDLTKSRDAHLGTINDLRLQMEDLLGKFSTLSGEDSTQKVALKDLKESYSSLLTRYHELLEESNSLTSQNEELRIRLARSEDDIAEGKDELSKVVRSHATVQHELLTKINQLEKLIDYLQSKLNKRAKCRSVFSSHAKCSSDKENMALPYEALKEKLKEEEGKNAGLLKELNSLRGELRCSRTNPTTFLLPSNDQRANHSIPHRWTSQTNMKVTKCSTCFGFVHFCRQASVCQHCHRTVHSHCAPKSQDDCGLPKTLAPVLKSSSSGSGKKPFEGYLKIPEQGGKYWMSVHVRIHDDRLILKGEGMETREINLMPSNGFVYIQSSVVYTELLHTTAYDQPHVFKIGYSNAKDTHYFMAKSFTDKALWIKEIENISLRMKYEAALLSEDSEDEEEDDELADNRVLAALDPSYNIYCVAPMKDSWLLGTSSGFLFVHGGSFSPVERSPSSVYQMEIVPSINKIVLITGQSRKLGVLNMDRIHSRDFNPVNLSAVKSCHLFGLGVTEGLVYLCAVDDCRVSIFKYEGSAFQLVHKFSTDNPTSCLQFTASSVLVITDKIYDIDLEDFAVEEFLDLDESPMTLSNNYPIAMFQINPKEFLLCFQERGLFVNSSGNKSRPDIKWNSISGQFAYSKGKLWVTYYNAVEVFDLSFKEQTPGSSKMMLCKNPQILSGQGRVYLLEERNRDLVLLELTKEE